MEKQFEFTQEDAFDLYQTLVTVRGGYSAKVVRGGTVIRGDKTVLIRDLVEDALKKIEDRYRQETAPAVDDAAGKPE